MLAIPAYGRRHRPQRYVFHCHILEHEDNSMMRPLRIVP
jgi:FtsP/CotA-like multicopper oxidase with cupredoxin domain